MKYQCVNCEKLFNPEDDIIISGVASGWVFGSTTVFCRNCFERREKDKKYCSDCKYWKSGLKYFFFRVEPCKSCNKHNNWEENKLNLKDLE